MRIFEVFADDSYLDAIHKVATKLEAADYWVGQQGVDGRRVVRFLVKPDFRQETLDSLQAILGHSESARINVIPLEVTLPREEKEEKKTKEEKKDKKDSIATTREEMYNNVEKSARLDDNFLLLVFFSTVVVAIGLLEDNVAVVIGAMVIAPLLGPNIALALGTALGDTNLMWKALKTTLAGLTVALGITFFIGMVWPLNVESEELLARTRVGLDSAALAFASGAAGVLALTTGLPSVLVGVMVAVALLPPTATLGLFLGAGDLDLAYRAGLLLAINIVSVNLAAKITFLMKGVKPRTWLEKEKARQSMSLYLLFWLISLAVLLAAIYFLREIPSV